MLYKTHKKFAQLFGVVGLTSAYASDLLPSFSMGYNISDNVLIGTLILVGYSASTFGGEFPDIDSPTSVPARRYPLIHKIFRLFGVKHRGKFSHDFASIGLFFGALLVLFNFLMNNFWDNQGVMLGLMTYFLIFYGREIGNELAFSLANNEKQRKKLRLVSILGGTILVSVFALMMGWLPLTDNPTTLLKSLNAMKPIINVTVIFAWIGAYSHLFADMLTNEGVYILGQRMSPAKWAMRLNKIPFLIPVLMTALGYFLGQDVGAVAFGAMGIFMQYIIRKTDLKTGSKYEKMVYKIVKIVLIPATAMLVFTAFGGALI